MDQQDALDTANEGSQTDLQKRIDALEREGEKLKRALSKAGERDQVKAQKADRQAPRPDLV
jgi:hypothetical protein